MSPFVSELSSNVVVARRTASYFHHVWTRVLLDDNTVLLDDNTAGIILWIRAQSKENHFKHVVAQRVDTTWSSANNFEKTIEANFLCRDESVASQSIADFRHRFDVLITRFTVMRSL